MKARNTLLFIIIVLASLGGICAVFPEDGIALGNQKLYFPAIKDIVSNKTHSTSVLQRLQAIEESLSLQQYQDSVNRSIYIDSLSSYLKIFQESPSRIHLPDDNWNFFNSLFMGLDACRERQEIIRILHYGDSQIESDRMTAYIRQRLQERFGGTGPGLLPAVQAIQSYSVGQSASENIERFIVSGTHQNQASHRRYGVLGQFGLVNGESSISVNARSGKTVYENVRQFQTIRLFAGRTENLKGQLILSGKEAVKETVTEISAPLKVYTWDVSAPVNRFSLRLTGSGEVYGIAVDGTPGVAVDNIPFRGSSGTFFTLLDSTVMASMLGELNARLILLQFGGNTVPAIRGQKAIENYCNNLARQIAYWKKICPEAKIMLIGPSDMSTKINGRLETYPYLEPLVEAMKEMALQNGAAFWSLYEVMGGHNSMIEWVKQSPALAATDYIHFTSRGVERVATLFYETLMVYYDYYRFITENNAKKEIRE